jgi:hypothetical protein
MSRLDALQPPAQSEVLQVAHAITNKNKHANSGSYLRFSQAKIAINGFCAGARKKYHR